MTDVKDAFLPTESGAFRVYSYAFDDPNNPHIALVTNDGLDNTLPVWLRIHSECLTGDVFGSLRCDCGFQLRKSLDLIQRFGGMLIYLRQEGRGIGLHNKIGAYALQDEGYDTIEANHKLGFDSDLRNYEPAVKILKEWKINRVRLISNNPLKKTYLESNGIEISELFPMIKPLDSYNEAYLRTKREKMGHHLPQE
jgi:3,4-dihydroxy 2-butanone 4-phosphate synthase / GTP cyclohydrolase II